MVTMHTVIETHEFITQAKKLLSGEERTSVISELGKNPLAGDVIKGTGGFRKLRIARQGSGKSGGYRVIYFFDGGNTRNFNFCLCKKQTRKLN